MGNHATRSLCTSADDTAAAKGAAVRLFTYAGVPVDALVAYERAVLCLSHSLHYLRLSTAAATDSAVVCAAASTPAGSVGRTNASQLPRRPLFQVCVDVQNALRQRSEQQQPLRRTSKDKKVVAGNSAYQDGVPVLLQELAWEWRSSASRERRGKVSRAGRPPSLRAEETATWYVRTAQLLQDYVRSRRYEKALRHARKAGVTDAGGCTSARAVPRKGRVNSDGAPQPRVFRELFKSYAVLGRSLTQYRRSGGSRAASSSSTHFTSDVTPSMWCAVLSQFLRALPEPLIPSLCGRRLEPLVGAPSSRPTGTEASASVTRGAHAAIRRVVEESFISTNVVAYTTFCYILDLVQEHRAELTGDEVETVAQAIVRESGLHQLKREVAHACKPEVHMFWPPPTSAGAPSKTAAAAARAHKVELRRGRRKSSRGHTGDISSSTTLPASLQGTAGAAAAVKAETAAGATAAGTMTAAQHGGGMAPSRDDGTSSCVSSDSSSAEGTETSGGGIGNGSESEERAASDGAADAHGRFAGAKGAAHLSAAVTGNTPTALTTHTAAGGGIRRPTTSPSSATTSEEDDGESERYPSAVAGGGIPVAAQLTEGVRHASPAPQQSSLRTTTAATSHLKLEGKENCMTSNPAPFLTSVPLVSENNNSLASEHSRGVGQHRIRRIMPLSEDDDMRLSSMPASRQELTVLDVSKLHFALYPSELEDPGAMEAEAEALRYALQEFSKPSPAAATNSRSHEGDGGGHHPRSPKEECGSQQGAVIGSISASSASVPTRLPLLSSSHRIRSSSASLRRAERRLMPRCGITATAASAIARLPSSPSSHLKSSSSAKELAARQPAAAYRAQAEQPVLTALMVAKQRFLAALTMTPRGDNVVALTPPHAKERVGCTAASGENSSGGSVDHRLERVMACAREMGWASLESLIQSLKAASLHSRNKATTVSEAEAASLSTPHSPELKREALSSSSNARDLQGRPQPREEAPHHACRRAVANLPLPRLMSPSDAFFGVDCSITDGRSEYDRQSQQPHAPPQGVDSRLSFPSPEAEAADSAMRVEMTRAFRSSVMSHARPQGVSLPLSPTAVSGRVAGSEHAQICAPLQREGHTSNSRTAPLTMKAVPTIATAGAATAQPFSGLDQELEKLRRLVRTLESRQFVQARQSSAQASELSARCAELQHQQLEQEKQLRLACARLLDVGKMLEELRSVKTHLQGQLMASRQEGARLRDALLLGEVRR